jgi:tetratricopeptide (TPR) repeat protein
VLVIGDLLGSVDGQPLEVVPGQSTIPSRTVSVADLDSDEYPENDDHEIKANGRPVLIFDMCDESPEQHRNPPRNLNLASARSLDQISDPHLFSQPRPGPNPVALDGRFVAEAERAIQLNPNAATVLAYLGESFALMGEDERGIALARRAAKLDPYHPTWYNFAFAHYHYQRHEYAEALIAARKLNLPD